MFGEFQYSRIISRDIYRGVISVTRVTIYIMVMVVKPVDALEWSNHLFSNDRFSFNE